MDDQNINGNEHTSIPAYQVLDELNAAGLRDAGSTTDPFGGMPQMPQMPHQTVFPDEQQDYQQSKAMYAGDPQNYQQQQGYAGDSQNYQQQPGYAGDPQNYQQQQGYAGDPQNYQQAQYGYADPQYGYSAPHMQYATKFCKYCAAKIPMDAVICTACGRQVESLNQGQYFINNTQVNAPMDYANYAAMMAGARPKNKWLSFALCLAFGYFGVHKFYEGKIGWGILYLCTVGLCGVGWLVDLILILLKPDPYYV